MGTKGSSALKEIFIGSSTIQVLQNIDFCPIVAVPSDYTIAPPAVIAFATNFEHIYTKGELAPLIELARLSAADIAIIQVDKGDGLSESQEAVKEALVKKFKGIPSRFQEVVGQSRISEAIMSFAVENEDVGLVAMINYWHSFLDKLTRENVIRQVAFHTEVPMLIFHFIKPS
jgi:nucleotide-binding universal stress UspA family protein